MSQATVTLLIGILIGVVLSRTSLPLVGLKAKG